MKREAQVFNHGRLAGLLTEFGDGRYGFEYESSYLADQKTEAVSRTLPKREDAFEAEELFAFFDGLIPEGWLLDFTTKNWKLSRDDRMGLLMVACRDCIGSVHIESGKVVSEKPAAYDSKLRSSKIKRKFKNCLRCLRPLQEPGELYHAACATRLFDTKMTPVLDLDFESVERLAHAQISRRLAVTGVQRKLSLDLQGEVQKRLTLVGPMGHYIVKPPTPEYSELPEIEHVTMQLAELCGLQTAENALIPLASGELSYVTRRFDRRKANKIAVEDLCQLSGRSTKNKYKSSVEVAAKTIAQFSEAVGDDHLRYFELLLFSFAVGNGDLHLKNVSFWRNPKSGLFQLSPAYDLVSTRLAIGKDEREESALAMNGKKAKFKWTDFKTLADHLGIAQKTQIGLRDRLVEQESDMHALIDRSYLSEKNRVGFKALIKARLKRLQ